MGHWKRKNNSLVYIVSTLVLELLFLEDRVDHITSGWKCQSLFLQSKIKKTFKVDLQCTLHFQPCLCFQIHLSSLLATPAPGWLHIPANRPLHHLLNITSFVGLILLGIVHWFGFGIPEALYFISLLRYYCSWAIY